MDISMRILPIEELNKFESTTLMGSLGIKFTRLTEEFVEATMPVDHRTHQPMGLLHGGASVALAETLGSVGANLVIDPSQFRCVGLEINANHLSSVTSGIVTGVAKPIHVGRSTQVWEIKITSDQGKLVCISRLTMAIVPVNR
jgi:1,4-dihydroxy-2-naphthoyl-CoA hydrolase